MVYPLKMRGVGGSPPSSYLSTAHLQNFYELYNALFPNMLGTGYLMAHVSNVWSGFFLLYRQAITYASSRKEIPSPDLIQGNLGFKMG
jgi:hypothetical protein